MSLPSGVWEYHGNRRFKDRFYPELVLQARLIATRNLAHEQFPAKLTVANRRSINERLVSAFLTQSDWREGSFSIVPTEITPPEATYLVERQLAEPELFQREGGSLLVSGDSRVSIQFSGNDHLRWIGTGQGVAYRRLLEEMEREFEVLSNFEFAHDTQFGFLTSDPTEVGGYRFLGILHLPGIIITDNFETLAAELAGEGLKISNLIGSMRPAPGALVVLTHRQTAVEDPLELVDKLENATMKIARRERACRRAIIQSNRNQLEDMISRAYGLLKFARNISLEEFIVLHSSLRLGLDFGWVRGITSSAIELLTERVGSAYIEMRGTAHNEDEINSARARLIHEALSNTRLLFDESDDNR